MKCSICNKNAVFLNPSYCNVHFNRYFEKKVLHTISNFNLLARNEKIAVAVSGGKDSLSLLFLLRKSGYNVTALSIDEGIADYRDKTLKHMVGMCNNYGIPYKIVYFKDIFGRALDDILSSEKVRPCSVCGIFRRYLINRAAKDFDVLATAHNLDDEAQAVVMNLIKGNIGLLQRQGPVSGLNYSGTFVKRVKPFFLTSEKEIMAYSVINKLNAAFGECPYVGVSFRLKVRDLLNDTEMKKPGTKKRLIEWFLYYKKNLCPAEEINISCCQLCQAPSQHEICSACQYILKIGN